MYQLPSPLNALFVSVMSVIPELANWTLRQMKLSAIVIVSPTLLVAVKPLPQTPTLTFLTGCEKWILNTGEKFWGEQLGEP
jgi:hypothetical protein